MSATTKKEKKASPREAWGSLRRLPSGRWQARYPGPDGETHTARTEDDKALTFQTKTDARTWLSSVHTKIALGTWEIPEVMATRRRAEAEAEAARTIGFTEYTDRWIEMIRTQPNRSGKMRSEGTIRSYKGQVTGYLIPEFDNTPIREIDKERIRLMTDKLDKIPSPLNIRESARLGPPDGVSSPQQATERRVAQAVYSQLHSLRSSTTPDRAQVNRPGFYAAAI